MGRKGRGARYAEPRAVCWSLGEAGGGWGSPGEAGEPGGARERQADWGPILSPTHQLAV